MPETAMRRALRALTRRLSYANVTATVAVFIALGGTSYAVATGSIGTRQIKNNAIRSRDVRNGTLTGDRRQERCADRRRRPRVEPHDGAVREYRRPRRCRERHRRP
jgi:hypothetical protein